MSERLFTIEDNDIVMNREELQRRLTIVAGGIALATSLVLAPSQAELPVETAVAVSTNTGYTTEQCPVVTHTERSAVKHDFTQPSSAAFNDMEERLHSIWDNIGTLSEGGRVYIDPNNNELDEEFTKRERRNHIKEIKIKEDMYAKVAQKHGLHTVASLPYILPLINKSQAQMDTTPFAVYFDAAKRYSHEFGIEMIPDELHADDHYELPSEAVLNTTTAKQNMLTLIDTLSSRPVEYLQMSGIKKIAFMAHKDIEGKTSVTAAHIVINETSNDGIVSLNLKTRLEKSTDAHEISHGVNEELCGGGEAMSNNAQLAALNHGIEYTDKDTSTSDYTAEKYQDEIHGIDEKVLRSDDTDGKYAALVKKLGAKVNFLGKYAKTHVSEDFAETAKSIGDIEGYDVYSNKNTQRLNEKFYYAMAMVKQRSSALYGYFRDMMYHYE